MTYKKLPHPERPGFFNFFSVDKKYNLIDLKKLFKLLAINLDPLKFCSVKFLKAPFLLIFVSLLLFIRIGRSDSLFLLHWDDSSETSDISRTKKILFGIIFSFIIFFN